MAGSVSKDTGTGRPSEAISSSQRSADCLAEWRSSEQVEDGTPSISLPYWDTDDDDDDCVVKPSDLYGKFTWKIENFSQISKRELRSNAFEVGGYKWYILVYPQGCDVCNHLSLFLCVANHEKLLPGWSHFAQFTIAVVNKDPKKSKYSDTLHRFWKKEHDWGWKKFMELSKFLDGFIVSDTLVIKAQVQVIREKAHHPFRCLDCLYRRELVRVYLTNVEGICRRFVEERRSKLVKLIDDKTRWSSFCTFWLGVDQNARRRMSREKTDTILKVVVKHFFLEKEVTSSLVMDSLYSGLRALEYQSKNKGRSKVAELEDTPVPIIYVEKDMFALSDDVLLLLERAALEPLPPSKDDKGPQIRTKMDSSQTSEIETEILCHCKRRVACRTSKTWENPFRKFLRCPGFFENNSKQCTYFHWLDEEQPISILTAHRMQLWLQEKNNNKALHITIADIQKKLRRLEVENEELQMMACMVPVLEKKIEEMKNERFAKPKPTTKLGWKGIVLFLVLAIFVYFSTFIQKYVPDMKALP